MNNDNEAGLIARMLERQSGAASREPSPDVWRVNRRHACVNREATVHPWLRSRTRLEKGPMLWLRMLIALFGLCFMAADTVLNLARWLL